jgi:hypothetical protein
MALSARGAARHSFHARSLELKTAQTDSAHCRRVDVILERDQNIERTKAQQCPEVTEGG